MPILELTTNVKVSDPKQFSLDLNTEAAKVLGMGPYVTVSYNYNETVTFAGTHAPAFIMRVTTLGNSTDKNEQFSKALFAHLEAALGTPSDRGYIIFNDPSHINLGHKGTTFATLFK
ncbi:Tautomerase/MIF [Mycena maculata]|uniref:L-dopachrome isomerase n=1 Tax=Mycena maculata TaxID=230809 RepID=A0AAD7IPA9_9AGAR|nr:Tautomerase/MIF [Mycena maculata]